MVAAFPIAPPVSGTRDESLQALVLAGRNIFTLVTYHRRILFDDSKARESLHDAIEHIREKHPFEIVSMVLLPEHLHTVLTLPPGDDDYPMRGRRIKEEFTERFLEVGGNEMQQTAGRRRKGYRGIWQKRYWEHTCLSEADLRSCVDYVHYNPKKHGLVRNVRDWPWSTFHRFVEWGEYTNDWGAVDPAPGYDDPEWGE
jgi:putative transposase